MIETATMKNRYYALVQNELMPLKEQGYTIYMSDNMDLTWAYVVTPRQNLLTIGYEYEGWWSSFDYQPTTYDLGSGCSCDDNERHQCPLNFYGSILERIIQCERNGAAFASRIGATRYETPELGLQRQFFFDRMHEL